jgi:glutathione S-transferase
MVREHQTRNLEIPGSMRSLSSGGAKAPTRWHRPGMTWEECSMLTLYFAPGSSSFAVHIALHEIGVPFEGRPMSFKKDDMHSPAYLALNPEGKVPTLVVDGRPLTEVAAILYYLAKRFPDAGLLPRDDIEADAQALSWMSFAASTLHPARRHGLDHARDVWGIADRRLGSGWALGRYSIADIHLFRLYWRFANSLKPAPEDFPNLTAHYARMMARPAVQRTIEAESAVGYELPG